LNPDDGISPWIEGIATVIRPEADYVLFERLAATIKCLFDDETQEVAQLRGPGELLGRENTVEFLED